MMEGRLFIDGLDAYAEWGAYVTGGGYDELVSYPPLKQPESNDWQEDDGIEPDLSAPRLNTREVQLELAFSGLYSNFPALISRLADGAYHEFRCRSIARTFRLRLTQQPNLDLLRLLGTATLRLADDFPLGGYTYQAPASTMPESGDYLLDGIPLTRYGCRVLQGSLAEVMKAPQTKQNLLRNIATLPGADYDTDGPVTFRAKDVRLSCLFRAESLQQLWRNHLALLHDLVQPAERTVSVSTGEVEQDFPCHYKSAQVTAFSPEGRPWLEMTLTLTFTRNFRIDADGGFLLAAEDGTLVFTQDGQSAIEMKPIKTQTA